MIVPLLVAAAAAVPPPAPHGRIHPPLRHAPRAGFIPAGIGLVALAAFVFDRAGVVIPASMAAATALHVFQDRRAARAQTKRQDAAAILLGHVGSAVEAGAALPAALQRACEQMPAGTPAELVRDARLMAHNVDPATPELARLAALWRVSASRGVPVGRLIAAARDELDHARRHRAATNAALAGPSTTAVVLAALPLAGVAMGTAMGANPLSFLTGGGIGSVLLMVGTALVCAGVIVSQKIIKEAAS